MKAGWRTESIGDLCDLVTGGTPSKSKPEYFRDGDIRWLVSGDVHQSEIFDCEGRITKLGLQNSNARFLPQDSVIIALNGQGKTRGTVALLRTEATCNQSLVAISPRNRDVLLPEYLFFNLHSRYLELRKLTGDAGNERRGLNMPILRSISIPVPPRDEQHRIVAVLGEALEELARARAHAEANLKNARELFDVTVFDIFERLRSTHHGVALQHLTSKITKGSSPKWQGISYVDTPGVLFVTSENVGKNELDLTKPKYVEDAFNEKDKKSILASGDVLTNIVGASIGRTAVFDSTEVANINQAVCLIRCDLTRLDNYFLSYLLNSPYFKAVLHSGEVNMARANLSLAFFRELPVPVPPIEVQKETVEAIVELQRKSKTLEDAYTGKLQSLDDLRQSLLQKAFAGQLT